MMPWDDSNEYGIKRNCCPLCGGDIIVSQLFQTSHDYRVLKSGKLSKNFTRVGEQSLECAIAGCANEDCEAQWDCDDFAIEADGRFYDFKYAKENDIEND